MILEDFTSAIKNPDRIVREVYDTFDHDQLDVVLARCCAGIISGQKIDPKHYGLVAACVVDPKGREVYAVNYLNDAGERVHAERAAIEEYLRRHDRVPLDSIVVTTLSPCSGDTMDNRSGSSCTQLLDDYGIRHVYVGYSDPTQNDTVLFNNRTFEIEQTDRQKLRDLCRVISSSFLNKVAINEVLSLTHIGKRGNLDNLAGGGKPLPKNVDIKRELGELVGKMSGGLEVYRFRRGGSTAYTVYDADTRTAHIAVSGNRYPGNTDSFVIFGVYAGPNNRTRAADLYAWLIRELGLTLVSDDKQSTGGQRVWQELQRRYGRSFNIYGFDTRTNKAVNLTALDTDETHASQAEIDAAEPGMRREIEQRAKNIRLVASPR